MTQENIRSIPFGRPWITDDDRRAVQDVLEGPILAHGPHSKAFESEFAAFLGGEAHAVSVSSGMAALHLSYLLLGIGPGDEVVVPALTHVATVHAVELVGAKPVFADCDPRTGNVTVKTIAPLITSRTKAIGVVHFVGIPCAMPDIMAFAESKGLKVVEDCALAVGTRYGGVHVGLFGDTGIFSFYPVKHITTGEGGMAVSRYKDLAAKIASFRAFGVDRSHSEREIPGYYDVPTLGLNYRMGEIPAALGRSQLTRIREILAKRRRNFDMLKAGLLSISGLRVLDAVEQEAENSYYCLSVILEGVRGTARNAIVKELGERGIGTSIYYPRPVPFMSYYREKYASDPRAYPNASLISDQSIALPVGVHLNEDDIGYMVEVIQDVVKKFP